MDKRSKARAAILACKSASEINTKMWTDAGLPFEAFLRFAQLPDGVANDKLRKLQQVWRDRVSV